MTNVFLIPSWYPNKSEPISGTFTKEQSIWISESDEASYVVSIIETYPLTPKKPILSLKNIFAYLQEKKRNIRVNKNYLEIVTPCFMWSKSFLNGNLKNTYKIHRRNFIEMLKKQNIDIIHAHVSYPAGYFAYLLSDEFKIPYIITEHMSPFPFSGLLKNNMLLHEVKVALDNSYYNVAVSQSLQKEMLEFDLKKPLVIPNFIDEEIYRYRDRIVNKDRYVFLTVGSLTPQKGIDLLIKAVALLKKEIDIQKLMFKIVGDGSCREAYAKLIKEFNLEECIVFLGRLEREAVLKEFQDCDAFVLPSRHESFGVVYIEALACGKPVIATRCGGPETIVNDTVGVLIEKEDPKALKEAIKQMYLNYEDYSNEEIKKYFISHFSKKTNIKKYLKIYREAVYVRN